MPPPGANPQRTVTDHAKRMVGFREHILFQLYPPHLVALHCIALNCTALHCTAIQSASSPSVPFQHHPAPQGSWCTNNASADQGRKCTNNVRATRGRKCRGRRICSGTFPGPVPAYLLHPSVCWWWR